LQRTLAQGHASNLLASPGVVAREAKAKVIGDKRALSKSKRAVEKYGNIDHQMKKARVVGTQAHTEKILVNTIQTQIKNKIFTSLFMASKDAMNCW
jgi:hypothetical protein